MIDLTAACQRTADVLANVTDEQLIAPTPCERMRVSDLVAHVGGLALAFTAAARKEFGPAVPIADDAPVVARVIALSGRDPGWGSGIG